ncbi:MAG: agmatinase [Candidatus Thorarchaeota archaeon]
MAMEGVSPVVNTFFGTTTDPSSAVFVFMGVPFDKTSTHRLGAKHGPAAIRTASQAIESFCLQEQNTIDAALLPIADIGDVIFDQNSVQSMLRAVESVVGQITQQEKTPLLLGGEHTLTLAAVRALPRDIVLLQFDAHMDLRDRFNGQEFSHACVQRRIVEQLGPDHLIQIGVRAVSKEEYDYAQEHNITFYTCDAIRKEGAATIAHRINEAIPPGPPIYISIDMDVLDPAYAPAVGNPEAGGISTSQLLTILRVIAPRAKIFDISEITPQYDQGITAIAAARIITTFLCVQANRLSQASSK